jgi:hypothetical protein
MRYEVVAIPEYTIVTRTVRRIDGRYRNWMIVEPGMDFQFAPEVLDGNTLLMRVDKSGKKALKVVAGR